MIPGVRRFFGAGALPELPDSQDLACLREIRLAMTASYPLVPVFRIAKILRKFGQKRFPAGLLLESSSRRAGLGMLIRAQIPRFARSINWHPLFDSAAYLVLNPDVAAGGRSPWLHYQVFGRMEGRSPHPFVDVRLLAASMPGVPLGEVVDQYLAVPELWTLDTSPYVDCQRFLLSGLWDGVTNPLVQVVKSHRGGAWIHHRLMLIDTTIDDPITARQVAVATLVAKKGVSARFNDLLLWRPVNTAPPSGVSRDDYTVVPGFFLGAHGVILASTPQQIVSEDFTMIQLSGEYVSLVAGAHFRADLLLYLSGSVSREELSGLLLSTSGSLIVAPSSRQQQRAAEELLRINGDTSTRILEFGAQARVTSSKVQVRAPSEITVPAPDWVHVSGAEARKIAFVIGETALEMALQNPSIRTAVGNGAAICPVKSADVAIWEPLLRTRDVIVTVSEMVPALRGFVDDSSLRVLTPRTLAGVS